MGKRNRERIARIKAGKETSISESERKLAGKMIKTTLSQGSTSAQINRLRSLLNTGALSANKLKETIMDNAPKEMEKGIKKGIKEKKEITVEFLMKDFYKEAGFRGLCQEIGLSKDYFIDLAKQKIKETQL